MEIHSIDATLNLNNVLISAALSYNIYFWLRFGLANVFNNYLMIENL